MIKYPEKTKRPKIIPRWPITIVTDQGRIDGELRSVTDAGMFIHCNKPLHHGKIYCMVIKPTPEQSVEVKGKLLLSKPIGTGNDGSLLGMALSFVKLSEGDHQALSSLILYMEVNTMESVQRVKLKLHIETDKRTLEKEFSNLFDLRTFMENFFSLPDVAERRSGNFFLRYTGRERRIRA